MKASFLLQWCTCKTGSLMLPQERYPPCPLAVSTCVCHGQLRLTEYHKLDKLGPLYTRCTDVLLQDLATSWNREIRLWNSLIALKFDRHLGSTARQISERYYHYNIQYLRLHEILGCVCLMNRGLGVSSSFTAHTTMNPFFLSNGDRPIMPNSKMMVVPLC